MLMMISISASSIFIFMKHPMSMGLILMMQSILIALYSSIIINNFWFSYILFLIMIGGMMILFIYMTSIASNEKFTIKNSDIIINIISPLSIYWYVNMHESSMIMYSINQYNSSFNFLTKFMNYPSNLIIITTMAYLLFSMIVTIKISSINQGPLRQKF
uniref:NADH-ubiquinone oxidoreductase chain 6 n=1 Tax=Scolytinae sp. BMNH 1274712 TaxID=1796543 RepID=A0A140EG35_9CUCU|nr:NADH dehydrogenase subunit 6 [Scolytinae sp. BMNH 1274712]